MGRCEVEPCITNVGAPNITLFKFPSNPADAAKWLVAIGKPAMCVARNSRVCFRHFKQSDFEPRGESEELTLRPDAIPSILLNNPNRSLAKRRRVCKAKGCGVNTADNPEEKLFAFPVDPKRNKVWCDVAEFVADDSMGGYFMLCKRHFKRSSFRDLTARCLKFKQDPSYKTGPLNPKTGDYCPVGQEEFVDFGLDEECAVLVVEEDEDIDDSVVHEIRDDSIDSDTFANEEIIVGVPLNSETGLDSGSITVEERNAVPNISSELEVDTTPLASNGINRIDESSDTEITDQLNKKKQGIITRLNRLISGEESVVGASSNQEMKRTQNCIVKTEAFNYWSPPANRVRCPPLVRGWTTRLHPKKKRKKTNMGYENGKIKAHPLMMRSCRNYRLLKSTLVLPSKGYSPFGITGEPSETSLSSMRLSADVAENDIFHAVMERLSCNASEQYSFCALLWYKIPIKGGEVASPDLLADTPKGVDYALVFMAVGLFHQWCQLLAYHLMSNDEGAMAVATAVRQILSRCSHSGLRVKATICDWSIQNRMVYARLGVSNQQQWFLEEGKRVSCLYDPQRLLLQTRNMFRQFDIATRTSLQDDGTGIKLRAKWSDIMQAVAEDKKSSIQLMRKLTESHLQPFGLLTNKIELAAQVFSDTVAASIETFARYGVLESRAKATAFVAMFFNRLYDSLSGSSQYPDGGGGLRCRLQEDREHFHFSFWKNASSTLAQMKLVSHDRKKFPQLKSWQAQGWIATVEGVTSLWNDLRVELPNSTYLELSRLNLGPLEWLSDAVRIYWNPENPNRGPTAQEFSSTMESCLRQGITYTFSGTRENGSNEESGDELGIVDDSD